MTAILLLHLGALLGFLFQLGFLKGQRRLTPESRAYGVFILDIGLWVTLDILLYLPATIGVEEAIVKAMGVFWIPASFWIMTFVYRLVGRGRDWLYWTVAGMTAAAVLLYLLTDLGIAGTDRIGMVVVDRRAPTFWVFTIPPFVNSFVAIGLVWKARARARTPQRRAILTLVLVGGGLTTAMAGVVDGVIPSFGGFEAISRVGPIVPLLMAPFITYGMIRYRFLVHDLDNLAVEIFEDMGDGVVLVDVGDGVVAVNPSARKLLGLVGEPPRNLRMSDLAGDWEKIKAEGSGMVVAFDADGNRRDLAATCSSATRGSMSLGWTVLLRDLSDQRAAEELLMRTHEELEEEIDKRTRELQQVQKAEAVGMMTGGIAHDFNNLLAAILGFAVAAKEDLPEGHPILQDLEEILLAVRKAREVVDQMLAFSRQKKSKRGMIEVDDLVRRTAALLEVSLPASISISTRLPEEQVRVMGDAAQLQQALMNLCTNAYQAMAERGGELVLSASLIRLSTDLASSHRPVYANRSICVEVKDTGPGMTEVVRRKIFEPFYSAREDGEGTGLGLAAAQHIVKEHGGTIGVESAVGAGTTFSIFLPVIDEEPASGSKTSDIGEIAGSERILLVDDNKRVVRLLRRLLTSLGYRVTQFKDPVQALEAYRRSPLAFDLVIVDFEMPSMNGAQLATLLRKERVDAMVLMISGRAEESDREEARRAGIEWFLEKPISRDELALKVRDILDQCGRASRPSYEPGDPQATGR